MPLSEKKQVIKTKFQFAGFVNFEKHPKIVGTNYEEKTLIETLNTNADYYYLTSIMHTIEITYNLMNNLSLTTDSQQEIIVSGILIKKIVNRMGSYGIISVICSRN